MGLLSTENFAPLLLQSSTIPNAKTLIPLPAPANPSPAPPVRRGSLLQGFHGFDGSKFPMCFGNLNHFPVYCKPLINYNIPNSDPRLQSISSQILDAQSDTTPNITRRNFLRKTTRTGAAVGALGIATTAYASGGSTSYSYSKKWSEDELVTGTSKPDAEQKAATRRAAINANTSSAVADQNYQFYLGTQFTPPGNTTFENSATGATAYQINGVWTVTLAIISFERFGPWIP